MGWAEKAAEQDREKRASLSTEPVEVLSWKGPSPWLDDKMREFGGSLIHAANQLGAILDPPRVVGADGNVRAPAIDVPRTLLVQQMLMMRALAAMNDCLLVMTRGEGVLKPVPQGRPEE